MEQHDGMQHVASLSLNQYNYLAQKHGFMEAEYGIDRNQSTSLWLRVLLYPLMFLMSKLQGYSPIHNQKKLLLGRLLFMVFSKK